jgi:hypothetical protein
MMKLLVINFSQLPVTPIISNSRLVPFVHSLVFKTQNNFGAAGSVLPAEREKGVGRYQLCPVCPTQHN